jgi:hypothetical protein
MEAINKQIKRFAQIVQGGKMLDEVPDNHQGHQDKSGIVVERVALFHR